MRLDELILLTLEYSDKKLIAGRTLLQKTLYFINEKMGLGIEFSPHYYGPYSTQITDEIASLSAAGIVEEDVETFPSFGFGVTFEPRKYRYQLTEQGQKIAKLAEKRNRTDAKCVKKILETMKLAGAADDYKSLSVAAKMYHILKAKERMRASEILDEAKALDWSINEEEAKAAVNVLRNMGLIEVTKEEEPPESPKNNTDSRF
jgi:uncharacterized protein YwgA